MARAVSRSVGVDFGTSTSLVAEGVSNRQPLVFPVGRTTSWLPSLVGRGSDGALVVGEDADALHRDRVRRSIKRTITHNEQTVLLGDGTAMDADEAIMAVLQELSLRARAGGIQLSQDTTRLGCPAMWTGTQRQRLLNLADAAGLPVSDHTLIDEPIAAGVAWVEHRKATTRTTVAGKLLVFDMGGGTLDVALLDVYAEPGTPPEISVLSSWGIDEAGDALDDAIHRDLMSQLSQQGVDVGSSPDPEGISTLVLQAARDSKLLLSEGLDAPVAVRHPTISLPALHYTREQLEIAFATQLTRAKDLVFSVLRASRVTEEAVRSPQQIREIAEDTLVAEVDFVLLVGGMSRVPAVSRLLGALFPAADLHFDAGVAADESIVAGLAETVAYDRINLHRPPFNFVFEYDDASGHRQVQSVYDAYAPFYPHHHAMQRHILRHEWRPRPGEVPRRGEGRLRIETAAGAPVAINIDGQRGEAVKVPLGPKPPAVLIHPNGKVVIVDGKGGRTGFRIATWPVMRGPDHAQILAQRIREERGLVEHSWMKDPLFLH